MGLEPTTLRFVVRCCIDWATRDLIRKLLLNYLYTYMYFRVAQSVQHWTKKMSMLWVRVQLWARIFHFVFYKCVSNDKAFPMVPFILQVYTVQKLLILPSRLVLTTIDTCSSVLRYKVHFKNWASCFVVYSWPLIKLIYLKIFFL